MTDRESPFASLKAGPGCARHAGDPHNLCEMCWILEPEERDCANGSPHRAHTWKWDGELMVCSGRDPVEGRRGE